MTPPDDATLTALVRDWTGHDPRDPALYRQALTHGSATGSNGGQAARTDYQRLEFLGDRVLGLTLATDLYHRFPTEPEGVLSSRFHALVSGAACARVARALGLPAHIILGKQARDDGARDSENIAADIIEAVIGALYVDQGPDAAAAFVRRCWGPLIEDQAAAPKHPKSALQEWAAANNRKPPDYDQVERDGPAHAPRFTVTVRIANVAEATGEGASKGAAEAAAATRLLALVTGL